MANLIIILMSFLLLMATILLCKWQGSRLNLVQVYFIFVGLYLGIYSLLKALIQDYSNSDVLAITLVFGQIITILIVISIVTKYLANYLGESIENNYLFQQWAKVDNYIIYILVIIATVIKTLGYYKFNIVTNIDIAALDKIGQGVPYWFFSLMTLYIGLIFCAFIALIVKIAVSSTRDRVLWSLLTIWVITLTLLNGRRSFISLAIIGGMLWFAGQGKKLLRLKYLYAALIVALSFIIFSNIYQSYRHNMELPSVVQNSEYYHFPKEGFLIKTKSLPLAIFNIHSTLENFKIRSAIWEFNYLIIKSQLSSEKPIIPFGSILWQGFKNSVPRIIWPDKEVISLNDLTARLYGLPIIDYGKNNFAFSQADFGFLSIVIFPIIFVILLFSKKLLVKTTLENPNLFLMVTGFCLYYLINIEQNYAEIFILYRNIGLIVGFYLFGCGIIKLSAFFMTKLVHKVGLPQH
jgi:hypothetical protein